MLDPIVATLKAEVKASGLTQNEVADQLFISNSYLSEILHGKKTPPLATLRFMLNHFGYSIETVDQWGVWSQAEVDDIHRRAHEQVLALEGFIG